MLARKRIYILLGCGRYALMLMAAVGIAACQPFDLIELEPAGPIARDIDELFWTTVGLMSLVLIPVFIMTAWFSWKYRASNQHAQYCPDWDRSFWLEWLVWLTPGLIISILAVMTWIYSHRLDPYKPLESNRPPLEIQVIALDWKWLFIYPQFNIASVNEFTFPVDRPIDFKITSNTVMNAFFIPRLGGQIYAMAGMETQLHLIADSPGRYFGENTQFSGRGFPYQNFVATAASEQTYDAWLQNVKQSPATLDAKTFDRLAKASIKHPVTYYASVTPGLFDSVMAKFTKNKAFSNPLSPSAGAKQHVR